MRSIAVLSSLLAPVLAARPFLNEADTGLDVFLPTNGTLPPLTRMVGLPDFDAAARGYLNASAYTYYRNGAAGEWSYRNNLEAFGRIRLRPRVMVDITNVESTLPTSILGYNYSVPFFIAPAARGALANPEAEASIMRAAAKDNMLYIPSDFSSISLEAIAAAIPSNLTSTYTWFSQLYIDNNETTTETAIRAIEAAGPKAIFLTIDSAADGVRHRAVRYGAGSADSSLTLLTWERFAQIQALTKLPLIPKGIQTVEDAKAAVEAGAKAIYLSNHGGRQLDHSPSAFEVALEIHDEAPEIFGQVEVYADGGVRYGTDVLKLLALGVRAVGLGRPFMYANCYGEEGVRKVTSLLRSEIINDAGNAGIGDLNNISPSYLKLNDRNYNGWYA